ncbi:MAG: hypothetical protein M1823_005885 [Watsoniomyces obsoletus]|nr:MAG: hypothetical protein M1823_005885 [Watsoniomyces obsoletus]
MVGYSALQQRYDQLLEETRRAGSTKRRRKQIVRTGAALTAEVLDQREYERWLYEEGSSSESEDEDIYGSAAAFSVLPRVNEEEAEQIGQADALDAVTVLPLRKTGYVVGEDEEVVSPTLVEPGVGGGGGVVEAVEGVVSPTLVEPEVEGGGDLGGAVEEVQPAIIPTV